ncbi:MAG TPA: hypothetical protein VK843_12385 [Planctomycetota bacterium]|nr:hypothetical protein [Planctomycetota bacterium]
MLPRVAFVLASIFALAQAPAPVARDREIGKQPAYTSEPLYGLFVLNEAKNIRSWAVFDKSSKGSPYYDVLYFDCDSDGDLTEAGERFAGNFHPDQEWVCIQVGYEVKVRDTESRYKRFKFYAVPTKKGPTFWFTARWNDKVNIHGGYGDVGVAGTSFGTSPESAPVFHVEPGENLSYGLYTTETRYELEIGKEARIAMVVGRPGEGVRSLTALDEHFLDLRLEHLDGVLIGKNSSGVEIRVPFPIDHHC